MRLFTALWPPPDAVADLLSRVGVGSAPRGWRATDPAGWHVTLAFHGEADAGVCARRLDGAARGLVAPRLRIAGAGAFPGVRWAGVQADGDDELHRLVTAADGSVTGFVPHVTVLMALRRPGPGADPDPPLPWAEHRGPWWSPTEVLLVSSEPARRGSRYRVVHRVPLNGG